MGKVDDLLARVFPRRCVLCNEPSGAGSVCDGCRDDLPWLTNAYAVCGGRVTADQPLESRMSCLCVEGRQAERVVAALAYEYPVDRMITAGKFHRQLHYALALGELLATCVARNVATLPNVLVPVPLHRRRLLARGYNQSLEIARPVSELLSLRMEPRLCERLRDTPEQTGLSAVERRRNLHGAFAVSRDCVGARVAILDDVVTTGSTAAAVAQAFGDAGATDIQVWAVARAL